MIEIPVLRNDDPEVRKETQICTFVVQGDILEPLTSYYSSWWRLKVSVVWSLRYKTYLQMKVQLNKKGEPFASEIPLMGCRCMKVDDLQEAVRDILKKMLQVSLPDVIEILSSTGGSHDSCVKNVLRKAGE